MGAQAFVGQFGLAWHMSLPVRVENLVFPMATRPARMTNVVVVSNVLQLRKMIDFS